MFWYLVEVVEWLEKCLRYDLVKMLFWHTVLRLMFLWSVNMLLMFVTSALLARSVATG